MKRSSKQYWRNVVAVITWRAKPALAVLLLGVIAVNSANVTPVQATQAAHRPLSDFINAQGTTSTFNCCAPAVPDYLGWTRPFSTPAADQRLASVDYAGVANEWLVANGHPSLGTTFGGNITERPLPDGRAEVTVILHTENALAYLTPFDLNGPINQAQINPLLFGFRPQDLLADPTIEPALGDSHLKVAFKNTSPGAPLPDLIVAFLLGNPAPGQELISISFHASATGQLRAASGFPEGAPGRLTVAQTGLFMTQFKGATADGFPAERVELRRVGQ